MGINDKLNFLIEQYNQKHPLSKMQLEKLRLVVEYFCTDITYQDLSKKYNCSLSTVKRAMKDDLVKEVLGNDFFKLLKERSLSHKQNARHFIEKRTINLESCFFDKTKLFELNIIKNDDLNLFSQKEIKILETCLLFLKNGAEKGYEFIASRIGKSKTTVSCYLNDESLFVLLKPVFYNEIKRMLQEKTPAPSRLIQVKKEKINKILDYTEKNKNSSLRQISRDIQIDIRTLSLYLNDDYLMEIKERRKNK